MLNSPDWEAMFYWPDAKRRLWFISDRIAKGSLNRSDLIEAFGISVPQATADIRKWMELHPGAAHYDARVKCYRPTAFGPTPTEQALRDLCMMLASRPDMSRLMGRAERETFERARKLVNGAHP